MRGDGLISQPEKCSDHMAECNCFSAACVCGFGFQSAAITYALHVFMCQMTNNYVNLVVVGIKQCMHKNAGVVAQRYSF